MDAGNADACFSVLCTGVIVHAVCVESLCAAARPDGPSNPLLLLQMLLRFQPRNVNESLWRAAWTMLRAALACVCSMTGPNQDFGMRPLKASCDLWSASDLEHWRWCHRRVSAGCDWRQSLFPAHLGDSVLQPTSSWGVGGGGVCLKIGTRTAPAGAV